MNFVENRIVELLSKKQNFEISEEECCSKAYSCLRLDVFDTLNGDEKFHELCLKALDTNDDKHKIQAFHRLKKLAVDQAKYEIEDYEADFWRDIDEQNKNAMSGIG